MGYNFAAIEELFDSIAEYDKNTGVYYQLDNLSRDELLQTFIEISCNSTDDFLKIKETLTRIGIANRGKKILYQSCMILHKKNKFYLVHFKELFGLDAKATSMEADDYARRNKIANLLESWGLLDIINKDILYIPVSVAAPINVHVIPYKEKHEWEIRSKYEIGGFLKKDLITKEKV